MIKISFTSHKGHIKDVVDSCAILAKTQVKKYKARADDMKGKRQIYLILPIFQLCHGHISHKALLMAHEQLKEIR
jgi:hypothetical protein